MVQGGVGHQPGHQQGGDDREAAGDGGRTQGQDLRDLGLDHVLDAVVPEWGGLDGLGHVDYSFSTAAAAVIVEGRYSTSSWVSSMNASSNDAEIGVSS